METTLTERSIPVKTPIPIKRFFYSDLYIVTIGLLVFAAWYTKMPIVAFLPGSILAMVALITLDDFMPMLPIVLYIPAIFATKDPGPYWLQLLGAIPLVAGLVFHFVYYRPRIRKMRMAVPQILITLAMLLGGLGVVALENYLGTLAYNLMLGILPLVFYLLNGFYSKENGYVGFGKYFAKVSVWYGILLGAEVIATYFIKKPPLSNLGSGFAIDLGWGIDNNVATLLLLASPMAFYLASTEKQKVFYTVLGIINFAFTVITFSRGGILFGTLGAALTFVFAVKTNHGSARLKILIPCIVALAAVVAAYLAFMDDINAHILKLVNIDDKARGHVFLLVPFHAFPDNRLHGHRGDSGFRDLLSGQVRNSAQAHRSQQIRPVRADRLYMLRSVFADGYGYFHPVSDNGVRHADEPDRGNDQRQNRRVCRGEATAARVFADMILRQ